MLGLVIVMVLAQPPDAVEREGKIRRMIEEVAKSGRVVAAGESLSERVAGPREQVAPGQPPLLSFRYFEGLSRHRFGRLDLMLDDAGH